MKPMEFFSKYLYFTVFIIVIITIIIVYNTINLGSTNCKRISHFNITTPTASDASVNVLNITECYIKTAYNCCCTGNFTNDYVNLCALRNCSKQGVRALDFQIFSLNNKPVISANTNNNPHFKELYNHLDFYTTMIEVNKLFVMDNTNNEPLFLIFRICSSNLIIYTKIYQTLVELFGKKSYNPILYTNTSDNESFLNDTIRNMRGKVSIIIEYRNATLFNNSLYQIASYAIQSPSLYTTESKAWVNIRSPYKFLAPSTSTNYDFMSCGIFNKCNFIGMNFQTNDIYLKNYNKILTAPLTSIGVYFDANVDNSNNNDDNETYKAKYDKWKTVNE